MVPWKDSEWQETIAEVSRRATVDPEFRALALKDGAAAMSKVTTRPIPAGITFRFVDNSGSLKTIPLPDPLPEIEELSDLELEQVAGGNTTAVQGVNWNR